MGNQNKVRFGLSRVHYAVLTEGSSNVWTTPIAVPGAVNLDLSDNVATEKFYADNVEYYRTYANNGYSGTLEMAKIPEAMLADIWGMTADANGVIREKAGVEPKPFALLFEVDGDADKEYNVLYRCLPSGKPTAGSSTTGETATPVTQSFPFDALPLVTGATAQQGLIKSRTGSGTTTSVKEGWFSAVNVPSA